MLRELHISNFAVISDVRIELDAGLNCFTGATGAGKSLVIGALEVLLGLRNPSEMLRDGADEGRVSGLFDLKDAVHLAEVERLTDTPVGDDAGELLLTRRLYASGRTSASLNGHPITLAMLRQVAELLVDVHGQHDHQYLLKPANQIEVLDAFAQTADLRGRFAALHAELSQTRNRLADLTAGESLRKQQLELNNFQADEIDAAELDAGEYAELEARSSVLQNLERLRREAGAAYASLYESDGAILDRMKMIAAVLAELSAIDPALKPVAEGIREATIQSEEASLDLSRYLDRLDLDPAELAEVQDRLNTIHRVVNKYGRTVDDVLEHRVRLGEEIAELQKQHTDASSLQNKMPPLLQQMQRHGRDLTAKRTAAARKLSPLVQAELRQLGMEQAKFEVRVGGVESVDEITGSEGTASGHDAVEFIVQTNPGLAAQPLRRIASGGELSRVMLGLKGVLAAGDRVSVLVFDEIDSNVGGRLGAVIGDKLRALSSRHQVLCITHLPQIAAYADRHLTVRKTSSDRDTQTTVRRIDANDRIEELAEMIGGQRVTATTRAQAKELLETATTSASTIAAPPTKTPKAKASAKSPPKPGTRSKKPR